MKNFGSYMVYAIFFAVSIFWSRQYEKSGLISLRKKALYCALVTLPIIILQGCRYDVGTDYFSYLTLYRGFNMGNRVFLDWYRSEPLFIILCKFAYFILNGSNVGFFFINSILMNVLLFLTFDYYKDQISMPMIYFFYYMFCFPYFLNAERQGLAVVIIWYATKYVHEKKLVNFLCCILIATLFHNTAIIGITLYFINFIQGKYGKYIKRGMAVLLICSPFIFNQALNFASEYIEIFRKYNKFLRKDMGSGVETTNVNLLYMAFMVVILLFFIKILKRSKIDIFWISFLCIAQIFCYLLNSYIEWGFRMSFYFEFGVMYAYSFVYTKMKNQINRIVLLVFVVSLLLFYFTYKFYIQGNCEIFPYQFVWSYK